MRMHIYMTVKSVTAFGALSTSQTHGLQSNVVYNNLKKKYQEKWENAYLRVKSAKASRAPQYVGKIWEQISGPHLDQILDPLVNLPFDKLLLDMWCVINMLRTIENPQFAVAIKIFSG